MENEPEKQETNRSIQDYLSLGYLYLLALGMFKDVIYYGFMDVNILSYSSVLDVLLSPFVELGKNPITLVAILIIAFSFYKWVQYKVKKEKEKEETQEEKGIKIKSSVDTFLVLTAFGIFSFFIGNGLGGGHKYGEKLDAGSFDMTHQLIFTDKEKLPVKLLGNNSQYVFYVIEKGTQVSIAPISGNIKKIEKLPKQKKQK